MTTSPSPLALVASPAPAFALDRLSGIASSPPLKLSASERSLSAVEAGEFRAEEAFLTRDSDDLVGGFLRDVVVGAAMVLRLPPAWELALTELDRGPALPALTEAAVPVPAAVLAPAPAPAPAAFLGVPGPRDECLARPLDVAGTFPGPAIARGPRFVAGPAEFSRCRFIIKLAAGVVGAEATFRSPVG